VASKEFDELFEQAGLIARALRDAYKDVSGEDLNLEAALKNYPVLVVGAAAGAGVLAGWWIGHRKQLPEPPPPSKKKTMEFLEDLFPKQVNRMKEVLPEGAAEDAATAARNWMDTVLEPKLRQGIDSASETRLGSFVRETIRKLEQTGDTELDEPEDSPPR
jgi:hypothetical protein